MENLVPISGEEYNEIFVKPWKSSEYNRRCDMSFHSAQAESVPVQPTTSSDNASGGSRPDGTSATANSSSAQAGYAVAPGVAQVDRAISPPRDIPSNCFGGFLTAPLSPLQTQHRTAPNQKPVDACTTTTTADADISRSRLPSRPSKGSLLLAQYHHSMHNHSCPAENDGTYELPSDSGSHRHIRRHRKRQPPTAVSQRGTDAQSEWTTTATTQTSPVCALE